MKTKRKETQQSNSLVRVGILAVGVLLLVFLHPVLGQTMKDPANTSLTTGPDNPALVGMPEPATHALSIYKGQGMDLNLLQIPGSLLTNDVPWEPSFFVGVNYNHLLTVWDWNGHGVLPFLFHRMRFEGEGQLSKHWGLQHNYESHGAVLFRTRTFNPFASFGFSFAMGTGLSYAFGEPTYEDGPGGVKGGPHYRLQNYIVAEIVWAWLGLPDFAVVSRVHHRSGVYGLVAPQGVGSNFLAHGIRWYF